MDASGTMIGTTRISPEINKPGILHTVLILMGFVSVETLNGISLRLSVCFTKLECLMHMTSRSPTLVGAVSYYFGLRERHVLRKICRLYRRIPFSWTSVLI
jgi:hypothetical protein